MKATPTQKHLNDKKRLADKKRIEGKRAKANAAGIYGRTLYFTNAQLGEVLLWCAAKHWNPQSPLGALEALEKVEEARQVASSNHTESDTTATDGTSTPQCDLSRDVKAEEFDGDQALIKLGV